MTGRPATDDVIPGAFALSVGMPDLPAPDGWRWVKLTDVARLESGHTPSRKHPEYWDGDIRWLGIQDARQHHGREIHETRQTVSELGIANSSARILPAGTVCLSRTASVGYVLRLGRPMATSQDFVNWVCSEDVDPEFLMYLLIAEAESILRFGKGSTHTTVYFPEVKAFHVCLPRPDEQRRIVAKVEALLARVNAARDRLTRVPAILRRFRQSVLAAACSGRLTEELRTGAGDSSDARDLLQSILAKRRKVALPGTKARTKDPHDPDESQIEVHPETWELAALDQLTSQVTSGSRGWARFYSDSGAVFIRAQDINSDCLDLGAVAHVQPPQGSEGSRTRVELGDILVTITGANVTKSALVEVDLTEAYVSQHVALVRPVDQTISPFLILWVQSPAHGRAKLMADAYGAGKPGLNLDHLREMTIALPPLDEQREIVRRVESLFALADTIEQSATGALRRADRLTQSILSSAFRGELVPPQAAE